VGVVVRDGEVAGLECLRVELGAADASGRPAPVVVAESEFVIEADQIVKAVGQVKPALAETLGLKTDKGYVAVGADFETSVAGVYAIGDCIRARGAASTVMAVQDGKLAAEALDAKFNAVAAEVR
jgi:glutamate synthase (NADPH/NADH) small chain